MAMAKMVGGCDGNSRILLYNFVLSTGQKPQSPEEILEFLGEVKDDVAEEVESMAEERFEGPLKGFFKGIG